MCAFMIQTQNYNKLLEFCRGGTSIISLLNSEMMTIRFFITPKKQFKKVGAGHY